MDKQTGTVDRVFRGTFCFLKVEGKEDHFAHLNDFFQPRAMKVGQVVRFTAVEILVPGKWRYAAHNVEAIAA